MKILKYKKISAEFKPWDAVYLTVAQRLIEWVQTDALDVVHIGSTSAKVGGKGIIDLSVLYSPGGLNAAVQHLAALGFQDQISDKPFPPERPRKDGAVLVDGQIYLLHVHVIERDSVEHKKQLQYKDYMLSHPEARAEYENYKQKLLADGVTEQEAYGKLKSPFVKAVLAR